MSYNGIEEAISQLYEIIQDARSVPLSSDKCMVERDQILDLLDEISNELPNELKQAKTIVDSRSEVITSAKRDAEAIRKLLLNLLSNALKFTPKGGSVRVRVKTEGRFVKITVADTGRGMDSDTLAHLFDRFMDGGQNPMPPRGLGLGLPICQRIAQGHGGMIVAQSEEGKGSLFTVSLPAVKAGRVQLKDRGSDYAGGFNRTLVEMSDALSSEAFLQKYLD